jgi:hypothetical protein
MIGSLMLNVKLAYIDHFLLELEGWRVPVEIRLDLPKQNQARLAKYLNTFCEKTFEASHLRKESNES